MASDLRPPAEVADFYASYAEESRLLTGASRLEFERTKELLLRFLPPPPACIVDVGGAAGAYSLWLAERGYDVHLVDATPRLVEEARRRNDRRARPIASLTVGDARALPQHDASADAVLVMGPLYHLLEQSDRVTTLREARRVTRPGGMVAAAAISRYASALAGLVHKLTRDPRFIEIRNRDLESGRHINDTERADFFTTSYFHRPEDLRREMIAAGLDRVQVLGVEGIGEWLLDFDQRWAEPSLRDELVDVARRLESEASIVGMSAHFLGFGVRAEAVDA
jgi:ubiquinone/menaquinone biosynthesis C-methylase UbiE